MEALPLEGVRVLDLSRLIPGPFCTLILSDLGASVDKLEDPHAGDYLRIFPVLTDQEDNGAPDIDLQDHRRAERMGFPGRKVSESLVPCGTKDSSRQRLRPRTGCRPACTRADSAEPEAAIDRCPVWVRSFAVITCPPNTLCAEIHDRMPVILPRVTWPRWLGEEAAEPEQLEAVLRPHPAEDMMCWPVSRRVGNVKNNDPSLIEPIELSAA